MLRRREGARKRALALRGIAQMLDARSELVQNSFVAVVRDVDTRVLTRVDRDARRAGR